MRNSSAAKSWFRDGVAARVGAAAVILGTTTFSVEALPAREIAAAGTPPSACTAPATTTSRGSTFSATETLCRAFFDQGVVDQRPFSVTVSDTSELRNRQVITVSWKGAHPTGGLVTDEQGATAAQQEYPMVLMECRGIDSTQVPISERLSPATCWTATADERTGIWASPDPLWSLDMYNSPADQTLNVGVPKPYPQPCIDGGEGFLGNQYWVPFDAADGTAYPVGPSGCGGMPPEMSALTGVQQDQTIVPSDTTYAATNALGDGTNNFTVMTDETNASLGCTVGIPCSLVIIPIEGISCSANPQQGLPPYDICESQGSYAPGSYNNGDQTPSASVTGAYWWSASNWQRHVSVPLTFAVPANACLANTSTPLYFYGSELMVQATEQWNPYFCLNPKLFNVEHVQTAEPEAKFLLQNRSIDAAIEGGPPLHGGFFTTPTVQAPMGVTGFAIAYDIDSGGAPYTGLRLDPRLLAKLMTDSYPGDANIETGDVGIAHNPLAIYDDPEFKALNPAFALPTQPPPQSGPAAALFSIFTQSDVIWALTSYINADPEARAWLNGQPDPWGMLVNPAYNGIQLPVETWQLLDKSTSGPDYVQSGNPCLAQEKPATRTPDRPLLDNPQATLAQVAYNMQYSIAVSEETCTLVNNAEAWSEIGPETIGARFMMGVVPLASAEEYDLPAAALQTYVSPSAPANISSPVDRVFVAPSNASLRAAAALLQPDPSLESWVLPQAEFPSDPKAVNAYPGTMLMSADVPTQGLSATVAKQYGDYLRFAATTGQAPGVATGQLPAGYLPLTAANGLANEVAYTEAAANDVASQNGSVPPVVWAPPGSSKTSPSSSGASTSPRPSSQSGSSLPQSGQEQTAATGNQATGGSANNSSNGSTSGGKASESSGDLQPATKALPGGVVPAAATPGLSFGSGVGGLALPLALLIALLGGVAVATLWWRGRKQAPQ